MSTAVKGVAPGFLLMPAREYSWELVRRVEIEIPNEGSINQLLSEFASQGNVRFPGDDEFCLFADNTLLLWEVVRVLFASKQYPDLEDNQCLNVVALTVAGDKVVLHGEVIRSV